MSSVKSKNQLTRNVFSLTLVQLATYVLPLISVPVISRIIGPGRYGVINFAAAFVVYFNLLISYSFDFTATRKVAGDPDNIENRNRVFSEVFYTQCLLFAAATLVFIVLLFTVPQLKADRLLFIFSYLVCVSALFTQNWIFQAMQDLSKVAVFNIISRLLFTASILLLVRRGEDYIWQPFLIGVTQTVVAVWSFIWAFHTYKLKLIKIPWKECLQVLIDERIVFFSLIFVNLYSSTTTVILGLYQNTEQVGYYTAAQRLIIIAQSVLAMPLAQAFYPYVGRAFGESREKGLQVVQKLIPLIVAFLGLASILMFVLGPLVIRLFYGNKFEGAIPAFQVLAIVPLFFSLNNVLGIQIMMNLKMDKQFFRITAYAGILSVGLNLLMVKQWGYMATTVNWLVTEVFIFILMNWFLSREGLNPINMRFFTTAALGQYLQPLKQKFLRTR